MSEKYGATIVKTADIEVDLDEAKAWILANEPQCKDLPDGDQVEIYMSWAEGNEYDLDFSREILTYPLTDSHVGTVEIESHVGTVEIEVCKYCGSPRLSQEATIDTATGEVRDIYGLVYCRDCENESKSSSTVTVPMDFNVDTDFYRGE